MTHSEPSSGTQHSLLQHGLHLLGKLDEERLSSLGALLLVLKGHALVRTSRKLDQVEPGLIELLSDGSGFLLGETTVGKVCRVLGGRAHSIMSANKLFQFVKPRPRNSPS